MKPNLSHLYEATPVWLALFFTLTTCLTVGLLFTAIRQTSVRGASQFLMVSFSWLVVLGLLAHNQFFQQLDAKPPRFVVVLGPPLLVIISLLITSKGRLWINQLPLSRLTFLHIVRLPVELTLYGLYLYQQVPQLMTFEGGNYDILAGLTAPVIFYYAFKRKQLSPRWLLVWNVAMLGSVLNIVGHALLATPFPFQQLAFDQPNVAILKFPYVWLPGFVVPAVLFSHTVAILRLVKVFFNHRAVRRYGTENTEV
ncbi:hypothetical protein EXU85_30800 [Spirosoma sp. KCTC 42546]|uniref:hypothetical protein n=1 Tax=Spirosoma sp. KCTC 42546 TaxID=2520506 RepID=UPI00115AF241|nr:hypothetical protein [Spirosoma sp. KCTC 42546]QDK82761.1 hypothetical protein EXU85_30800 [Spirosoma sp. KCTC 42546]